MMPQSWNFAATSGSNTSRQLSTGAYNDVYNLDAGRRLVSRRIAVIVRALPGPR